MKANPWGEVEFFSDGTATAYPLKRETFKAEAGVTLDMWFREGTSDYNTILSILRDDEYLTSRIGVVKGGAYVDVGAHIGAWSMLVAALGGEVWAYEPLPENLALIIRNAQENGLEERVHARWAAVAHRGTGYERIHYANPDTESGMHHRFIGTPIPEELSWNFGPRDEYIYVPRFSFEQVLTDTGASAVWRNFLDVMKIDCEGAEWGFLKGAQGDDLVCVSRMVGEHHAIRDHMGGRAELLGLCGGLYEDLTEEADSKLGFFHFKLKE